MEGAMLLNFDSQLFTSVIGGLYLFAVIVGSGRGVKHAFPIDPS